MSHLKTEKTRYYSLMICAVLVIMNITLFGPVRNHEFINLDDNVYITENAQVREGITPRGILWAFTSIEGCNWHPLTWISHMIDVQLFGLNPAGHHLVNVLFHIANSILLFLVLRKITAALWPSAFVAVLFAVHPLHVESVAWAAERKDVLSTFFWMLTMGAYAFYAARPDLKKYLITLGLFALGLMAKPMLVTLPFVLLLLDFWPLKRWNTQEGLSRPASRSLDISETSRKKNKKDKPKAPSSPPKEKTFYTTHTQKSLYLLQEKIPFFVLAGLSCTITLIAQFKGGAAATIGEIPLMPRLENALVSYLLYIQKMFWPTDLAIFYPYEKVIPPWQFIGAALLVAAITYISIRFRKNQPWLAVGWFWYLGTLIPVLGLIQVGKQAMADRYTYIPLIGLFFVVTWGIPALLEKYALKKILSAASISVVIIFSFLTFRQVSFWKDDFTLFGHALQSTPENYLAHCNLGLALTMRGQYEEAYSHFSEALRIFPSSEVANNNIGMLLQKQGRLEEALVYFNKVLQTNPNNVESRKNIGITLSYLGKLDDAYAYFEESRRIKPDDAETHYYMGSILLRQKRLSEAMERLNEAVRLNPNHSQAHNLLGIALASTGQIEGAVMHFQMALRINPNYQEAFNNLRRAEAAMGIR